MIKKVAAFGITLTACVLLLGSARVGAGQSTIAAQASSTALSQAQIEAKIEPGLLSQARNYPASSAHYMVHLSEQADTSNSISPLKWKEKGEYVVDRLRATAARTQPAVNVALSSMANSGKITRVQPFWIDNAIYVEGSADTIYTLAARSDVGRISAIYTYHISDERSTAQSGTVAPTTVITSYGIITIGADQAWAEGYLGQGVTVGDMDTGVQYDHPAIQPHYRGTAILPGHDYNWFDAIGHQSTPYDDNGHGTNTAGTMVGQDLARQNIIGVAPLASLIACKAFDSTGNGNTVEALLCAQWMLAPTDLSGNNPRPELRPNVVNNSWGGVGIDQGFAEAVQQWVNAGIFPAFAAGNSGPAAETAASPGDLAAAFAVGATTSADLIANFSSRGPSPIDGRLKPDVSAPGTNVRTSVPPSDYAFESGTSISTPHVAGIVALLLSRNRSLTVSQLGGAITSSAYFTSFMGSRPNNNYGWGRVDAAAAVNSVPAASGAVIGHVSDGVNPLSGAAIVLFQAGGLPNFYGVTDGTGAYTITVPTGSQQLGAKEYGYTEQDVSLNVTNGMTVTQNFTLTLAATASLSGVIHLAQGGSPISGTLIVAAPSFTPTEETGSYSITIPSGTYTITLRPDDNCLAPQTAVVQVSGATTHDFLINQKRDGFGYTCGQGPLTSYITATNLITAWVGLPNPGSPPPRDDGVFTATLPFAFHYYGDDYTQMYISTNGFVDFAAPNWSEGGTLIPYPAPPNAAIYPFWTDLNLQPRGNVYTDVLGTAPNRQFVIEWRRVAGNFELNSEYSFEVILSEQSSIIAMQYQHMVMGRDAGLQVVGIEDAQGISGILYSWNIPTAIHDGLLIQWTPPLVEPTPTSTPTPASITATPTPTVPTATPTLAAYNGPGWQLWQPDLPLDVQRGGAEVLGNNLYLLGGRVGNSDLLDGVFYRPLTSGAWLSSTAHFPTNSLSNIKTAVLTDSTNTPRIYVISANRPGNEVSEAGRVFSFTPGGGGDSIVELEHWPATTLDGYPEMPGGSGVWQNKWYVFGGYGASPQYGQVYDDRTWVFDPTAPAGSHWTLLPTRLHVARYLMAAKCVDGVIYAAGGFGADGQQNWLEALDLSAPQPQWQYRTAAPAYMQLVSGYGFNTGSGTLFDGKFMMVRGDFAYIYDPSTDTWSNFTPFGSGVPAATQWGTKLYAVGDTGASQYSSELLDAAAPAQTQTPTPTPSSTPQTTPTDCPNLFVDITGNTFYQAIHYLNCRSIVNGTDATHYSPAGTSTRGQFAKVVVLGFGLTLFTPSGGVQDFTDVPTSYFAYAYIETGYVNHILSGFDQNSCIAHQAVFPCYLPNLPITRGQLTKLVVNAAHYPLFTPTGGNPTFTDVPPSNIFFVSIETAHSKGVINGYPDQTFRPNNNIRRDEMAQIVYKGIITP